MKKFLLGFALALLLQGAAAAANYSRTTTGTLFDIDTRGFAGISLGIGGSATGATLVVEANSDPTGGGTWYTVLCAPLDGSSGPTTNVAVTGKGYACPSPGPRLRVRLTAISSGTYTASMAFAALGGSINGAAEMAVAVAAADVTTSSPVTPTAGTVGGGDGSVIEVAASDNHQTFKTGAGTVYSISGFSKHSATLYARLYDAATGFNGCGSATGILWEGQLPNPGFSVSFGATGRKFVNGLSGCVTGAFGNTDTTSATASVASLNIVWK